MATKYSSWDKCMLTFTVPSVFKGKINKNNRYAKLRHLLKLRAFIGKCMNNSSGVKYFMNIELGKKFSNPHLHLQVWYDSSVTSATDIDLIKSKCISKFNLNSKRCYTTTPELNIDVYHYVIKDYSKNLSDDEIWNLETQKKRSRKFLRSRVRFISKSSDKYTKKAYRVVYSWGVVRNIANKYLDFFIENFFKFSSRNLPKIDSFCFGFSNLVIYRIKNELFVFCCSYIWLFDLLFVSPAASPPEMFLFFTILF